MVAISKPLSLNAFTVYVFALEAAVAVPEIVPVFVLNTNPAGSALSIVKESIAPPVEVSGKVRASFLLILTNEGTR